MHLSQIIVFVLASALSPFAWGWGLSGGAADSSELSQINRLARQPRFQAQCPIRSAIEKAKKDPAVVDLIGRNTLRWETDCNAKMTIEWDRHEGFPSIGLPHVVWFPPALDKTELVDESFPAFWAFLKQKYKKNNPGDVTFPAWVDPSNFPWTDRNSFENDHSAKMQQLQNFLNDPTVLRWQAEYAVNRGVQSAYKVLAASALEKGSHHPSKPICRNLQKLFKTPSGILSVFDYVNFKGEGIDPKEVRGDQNMRWGLKQVLEDMDSVSVPERFKEETRDTVQQKFAAAAVDKLAQLANAVPEDRQSVMQNYLRDDGKGGWFNRIESSYIKGGITPAQCPLYPSGEIKNQIAQRSNSTQ